VDSKSFTFFEFTNHILKFECGDDREKRVKVKTKRGTLWYFSNVAQQKLEEFINIDTLI
jgi:hypothetical protein